MKRKSVFLVLTLLMAVIASAFAGTTYGYFDVLSDTEDIGVQTGFWTAVNSAIRHINISDTEITTADGSTVSVLEYIAESIWSNVEYDENGNIVSGDINPLYADYTNEELIELIDVLVNYVSNYLTANESGEVIFPDRASVSSAEIGFDSLLAPGESVQLQSIFLAANLSSEIYWGPIMFSISIESPNGEDISDFAVELLYSANFSKSFAYEYLVYDSTSYNNYRANGSVNKNANKISLVSANTYTNLTVYKLTSGSYVKTSYRHTLNLPSFGSWSRFVKGPVMELRAPSDSNIGLQQELFSTTKTMNGLILMGKANGTKTEMRVQLTERGTAANNIDSIPFLLNVSRGIALDSKGNPLSYTASDVVPIIKVRLVSGDVWGS
jgi:hypothetical protein